MKKRQGVCSPGISRLYKERPSQVLHMHAFGLLKYGPSGLLSWLANLVMGLLGIGCANLLRQCSEKRMGREMRDLRILVAGFLEMCTSRLRVKVINWEKWLLCSGYPGLLRLYLEWGTKALRILSPDLL